jgi:endonuclease G
VPTRLPLLIAASIVALFSVNCTHHCSDDSQCSAGQICVSGVCTSGGGGGGVGHIRIDPPSASVTAHAGNPTPSTSFSVINDGTASMHWTVACSTGGTPNPSSGNQAVNTSAVVTVALASFPAPGAQTVTCTANTDGKGGPVTFTANIDVQGDTTPPTVSLTSPEEGSKLGGNLTLTADASDTESGVASVDFLVDGNLVGTSTAAPYKTVWSSWTVANGAHAITARAHDVAGNVATSAAVSITTNNGRLTITPATASVTATVNVATPGTGFTLGNDGGAPAAYAISCDSGASASPSSGTLAANVSSSVSVSLPTYAAAGTQTATCTIPSSNGVGSPLSFTVTVTVVQPTVQVSRPTAGAKVCARALLTATANKAGVAQVQFAIDGAVVGTAAAPFQLPWDSSAHANGAATLTATGLDANGAAMGPGHAVTITVANGDKSSGACTSVHLTLGQPEAVSNTIDSNHFLVSTWAQYAHSQNGALKTPNWVAWELNSGWLGANGRTGSWGTDPLLTAAHISQAVDNDYVGSGYDRGHMCPSADRTVGLADNDSTFIFSNAVPQEPKNNQGPWLDFENFERSLVASGKEAFIYSGPLYEWTGATPTVGTGVAVPSATWKVLVLLDKPGMGPQDVSTDPAHTRVVSIVIPNCWTGSTPLQTGCPNSTVVVNQTDKWTRFCTTVRDIEQRAGLNFLAEVPQMVQDVIETRLDSACP